MPCHIIICSRFYNVRFDAKIQIHKKDMPKLLYLMSFLFTARHLHGLRGHFAGLDHSDPCPGGRRAVQRTYSGAPHCAFHAAHTGSVEHADHDGVVDEWESWKKQR